ncbi:ribonuclease P protein component [Alkalispirochaeta americana]|uniref:Ribonuclease P protein component n=1 Tax=Alkalispirochaeta americana TaxID=159291 RepID=A0A1N6QC81_9SPIO|nr:ribonuclease P protein component [Alkalispirochaeta americana]SIQ14189.1 ribonuclease P protein component [Alkalispirochaeta americana]
MRKNLTKAEILRSKPEISIVFSSKVVYRTQGLHLRIVENDLGWSRVLFTTPRMFRGAVARNRARRHVREVYRLIKGQLRGHYDMAFVLYPGLYEFSDRFLQVETLLRRAEAIPQS